MKHYFVINAKDHKQYFIANISLNAVKEYKYINKVDKKESIELYFDDATFNELYYIENSTTKWLVVYNDFANKDKLLIEEFPTLAKAKEYVKQKEKIGLKQCRIVYGDIVYY